MVNNGEIHQKSPFSALNDDLTIFDNSYLVNNSRYSRDTFSTHQSLLGDDSDAFADKSCPYSAKNPEKIANFHEKVAKNLLFHGNCEF